MSILHLISVSESKTIQLNIRSLARDFLNNEVKLIALNIAHGKPLSTLCISLILSYLHQLHADSIRQNISDEND